MWSGWCGWCGWVQDDEAGSTTVCLSLSVLLSTSASSLSSSAKVCILMWLSAAKIVQRRWRLNKWARSSCRMITTEENRSTLRKTSPNSNCSPTQSDRELKPGIRGEILATNCIWAMTWRVFIMYVCMYVHTYIHAYVHTLIRARSYVHTAHSYNNNIYLLQLGCHPVAVVILHAYKIWNWLLLNLSREGYMRSM